jgi:hypothetical protein
LLGAAIVLLLCCYDVVWEGNWIVWGDETHEVGPNRPDKLDWMGNGSFIAINDDPVLNVVEVVGGSFVNLMKLSWSVQWTLLHCW